jgi:hypothetical protein
MGKKCIICDEDAIYKIKDTSDYYCQECAEENFADLTLLMNVEEEAQRLKEFLKGKMDDILHDEEELDKLITIKEKNEESDNDNHENV